jgi:hypothetical protein
MSDRTSVETEDQSINNATIELVEKTKREIILSVISKQEKILNEKEEELKRLMIEWGLTDKKRRIAKKALKKAKELKLATDKIALIKIENRQTKEQRKTCKSLIKQVQADIKNIKALIGLLDNII